MHTEIHARKWRKQSGRSSNNNNNNINNESRQTDLSPSAGRSRGPLDCEIYFRRPKLRGAGRVRFGLVRSVPPGLAPSQLRCQPSRAGGARCEPTIVNIDYVVGSAHLAGKPLGRGGRQGRDSGRWPARACVAAEGQSIKGGLHLLGGHPHSPPARAIRGRRAGRSLFNRPPSHLAGCRC